MPERRTGGRGSADVAERGVAGGTMAHAETTAVASGDYSHAENLSVASGARSHAEGTGTSFADYSHAEGYNTYASGVYSHAEGNSSQSGGESSHAEGGTTANGMYSHSEGFRAVAGRFAQHAKASFSIGLAGDAQHNRFCAGYNSTSATPVELVFNGTGNPVTLTGAQTNVLTVPVNRAHRFTIDVVARRNDVSGEAAGWAISGLLVRGATGTPAAIVGALDVKTWSTAAAGAWTVAVTVNTTDATNNYLSIVATGEAGQTIRWVATISTTEVG